MQNEAARLREMCDRQEIEQVVHVYCRAIDRLDAELLRSIYHPDGIDLHGSFEGNAHEFADFIMERLRRLTSYGFHTVTQSVITIAGNEAVSESTYIAYHRIPAGREPICAFFGEDYARAAEQAGTLDREHENSCGGRYLDRFERRYGVWKIARRRVTNEWNRNGATTNVFDQGELAHYKLPGTRDRSDPIYGMLAELGL